jgi:hypothetical protein
LNLKEGVKSRGVSPTNILYDVIEDVYALGANVTSFVSPVDLARGPGDRVSRALN